MAQFSSIGGDHFLLLIFFLPLQYFIFKLFKASASSKTIPGPIPWPLLGNIPHMVNKMPHVALSDLSKIHGPLFKLRLGTQELVVASSPAAAKEILKTHDRLLSARYVPKSISNPEELNEISIGWTETCSERWKYLRTLCKAELFSVKSLDAQSCLREKKILEMIEYVKAKNEGEAVNIGELVFVTVYNMMSNVLLSRDLIGYEEKNKDGGMKGFIRKMCEIALAPNISDLYPILSRFDLQGLKRNLMKIQMKIDSIYKPIIEERRKARALLSQKHDFLDVLYLNNFTDVHSYRLVTELISAGADTTTSTVEWTMAELIKSPESMTKVVGELERALGTDLVKESDLEKLPYLQACIKETLRLHPPAPLLLPRLAPETCQVMNYTIPENAQVYINIWAMGRDPLIWDEPLMFQPERFLNSTVDFKGNDFEFVPFGGGRRICPGLPMAGRQVHLVLATLLHLFNWSLPNEKGSQELDMAEKFGVSLQKEQPLFLIPKPRN